MIEFELRRFEKLGGTPLVKNETISQNVQLNKFWRLDFKTERRFVRF